MSNALEDVETHRGRKFRELQFLTSLTAGQEPAAALELPTILVRKERAARRIRAVALMNGALFGESRSDCGTEVQLGTHDLKWSYQRFDLQVAGPAIYDESSLSDVVSHRQTCYANSGMAAISAVLQALNSLYTTGLEVRHAPDAYFETQRYMQALCPSLSVSTVDLQRSQRPEGAFARGSSLPTCVLIDSVGYRAHDKLLGMPDLGQLELILIDTTCYAASGALLTGLIRRALAMNRPVILLRSHIKLDSLGLEYARLGSAVFLSPTTLDEERQQRFAALLQRTRLALSTGSLPHATQLFPASGNVHFERLNAERLQRVVAANQFFARQLCALRLNRVKAVKLHHHGLFSTVSLHDITNQSDARVAARELAQVLEVRGVPAAARGSFGLDVTTIDSYLDLAGPSVGRTSTLRIAMADCSHGVASGCVEGVRAWVQGARSAIRA